MIKFTQILFLLSIKTSFLIVIILAVKFIFNKFFTSKTHYSIWFLLFISLTIPYTPSSSISIYNIDFFSILNKSNLNLVSERNDDLNYRASENINSYNFVDSKDKTLNSQNNNQLDLKKDINQKNKMNGLFSNINLINISNINTDLILIGFSYLWLLGVLSLSLIILLNTIRLNQLISKATILLDQGKIDILSKCKKTLNMQTNIKLLESNSFSTPSLVGFFYPKIILPIDILNDFDDKKLEFIILHELSHLKRKDILTNWIILIYKVIYWFNPIIWIGFYKMKNDMEIACDALVLKNLDSKEHLRYGRIIIDLLEYFSRIPVLSTATNILENKSEVKRRIIMIKNFKKTSSKLTLISLLLIALVGCSSISSPNTQESQTQTSNIESNEVLDSPIDNSPIHLTKSDAQKIFDDKDKILGQDESSLYEVLGTPYVRTYYINTKDIQEGQILQNLSNEAVYPIKDNDESTALYMYIENNKIVDLKSNEFVGNPSNSWKDSDYKINFYTYINNSDIDIKDLPLSSDSEIELDKIKKDFIGKSISDFNDKFNISNLSSQVINKDESLKLTIIPVISEDYASAVDCFYILSEDDIIKNITSDRLDIEIERLDEYFQNVQN